MKLYDVVGTDKNLCFSPNVWKARLALNIKELKFETIPLRFDEIAPVIGPMIPKGKAATVPVLVDGDNVIHDSYEIVQYLEESYPATQRILFGSRAQDAFFNTWFALSFQRPMYQLTALDQLELLDEDQKEYIRRTRKEMIGMSLEELANYHPEAARESAQRSLEILAEFLSSFDYLAGDHPGWPDIVTAAHFTWVLRLNKATFQEIVLDDASPSIQNWWHNMQRYVY
ncbi:hypothetical protein BZG36_00361 [Bifiguratus adelaidae]|uniref:GST N-terminal domain-containing protein n=1 Tax=Bifiguratus adelaidae TaxID=1938954 RepID=A0A261Y7Y7_9FUNG|nr:hypothetical protein BZG36_00361 [Bifiguratus adelaidae]